MRAIELCTVFVSVFYVHSLSLRSFSSGFSSSFLFPRRLISHSIYLYGFVLFVYLAVAFALSAVDSRSPRRLMLTFWSHKHNSARSSLNVVR